MVNLHKFTLWKKVLKLCDNSSESFEMEPSKEPGLVFKEAKKAHAKSKTSLLLQKSERKKMEKYVK